MYFNIIWLAAGYLLGILISTHISYLSLLLFAVSLFILLIFRGIIKKQSTYRYLIFIAAFVLGMTNYMFASSIDFTDSAEYLDRYITVRGRISELPVSYSTSENDAYYYYIVDLREITYHGETISSRDRIRISTSDKYSYGDTIIAEGFLEEFADKMNSSSSDMRVHYKSRGIFFRMSALKTSEWGVKYFPISLRALTNKISSDTSDFIDAHYSDRAGAILKSVLIGDKTQFDDEYDKILDESGAKRLLYTPFLHIMIINLIIAALFSMLPINSRVRDFLLCAVLVIYILINGTSPTFIKLPLIMLLTIHRRRAAGSEHFPAILAGAVMLIAMFEPMCLFDAGFIISIVCTVLIYIFSPRLQRYMMFIHNSALRRTIAVSLIITVGILPLSMYFFGGSAVYTILCTLFFAPLVALLLAISPIVFLMTAIFGTAPIFAEIQGLILWLMDKIPRLIHALPFSFLRAGQPSVFSIILFYLLLALLKLAMDGKWKTMQSSFLRAVSAGLALSIIIIHASTLGTLQMTFVNVGQGDAAILHVPFRDTVLIDGGGGTPYSDYNVGRYVFLPYLEKAGFSDIDMAIVSHYHKDHCEGIIEAVKEMRVKKLLMPDCTPDDEYRLMLEDAARESGADIVYINGETTVDFKSGLKIHIIYPGISDLNSKDANDTSLVAEICYGKFSALFTGDITETAEKKLTDRKLVQKYDVLKVPHHGSAKSSSEEFVKTISPEYAVIGVGENNNYGMPTKECLKNFNEIGAKVLRTDQCGDIIFTVRKSGIQYVRGFKYGR